MPVSRLGVRSKVALGVVVSLFLLAGRAAAQNSAIWVGPSSGDFNTASNWLCSEGGQTIGACVPGAGYDVTAANVSLSISSNVGVSSILGNNALVVDSNTAVTTTGVLGVQFTGGVIELLQGSLINGQVETSFLSMDGATINGAVMVNHATLTNSTTGNLSIGEYLTTTNSVMGSASNLEITSAGSMTGSSIGGMLTIQGGTLTVDSSTFNATSALITSGSLTLQNGSTWSESGPAFFMGLAPGQSTLDVTGLGTTMTLHGTDLELGEVGNAQATVENTASLSTDKDILVGLGVGPFVTQSELDVKTGGTLSADGITVLGGSGNGSTGVLTVDGAGSSVTATGEMLVTGGGVVSATDQASLTVNTLTIQTGSVTIDDSTLTVNADTPPALVASQGTGSLTLQNGATGTMAGQLVVGGSAGSNGTVTIDDSELQAEGGVVIGYGGTGTLTVQNGASLKTGDDGTGLSAVIGLQNTGNGTVNVQGGSWQAGGSVEIGSDGTGTLNVSQAGTVQSEDATIGKDAGSSGSVNVAGVGSQWSVSGDVTVGSFGSGSLAISGGGTVTDVNATIGDKAGSSGSVNVIGVGSSWQNSGILNVGGDGAAGLTVDAGTVTAGGAAIGSNFAPVQVDVTNHGALSVLGDLSVGGATGTTVTVENGGTLDSGNHATIGGSGGETTVTVTGANSAWTLHGDAEMTIDDKGSLFVNNGGTVTANTITVDTGGSLNGQGGTVIGSVVNAGGTVTPGDAVGTMTINGDYTQTSGSLLLEIDGADQFDQLIVSGMANFTGGSIDVLFGNGFVPTDGEDFDLIMASLGLNVSNIDFNVAGLPDGLNFNDTFTANGLELSFMGTQSGGGGNNGGGGTPTPEAGSVVTLSLGVAALLLLRKKRALA